MIDYNIIFALHVTGQHDKFAEKVRVLLKPDLLGFIQFLFENTFYSAAGAIGLLKEALLVPKKRHPEEEKNMGDKKYVDK